MKKFLLSFSALFALLLITPNANAASLGIKLENIQIYMGDVLVDFQGQGGVLDSVSTKNGEIAITMPAESSLKLLSPSGRELSISPSDNSSESCESNKFGADIIIPANVAPQQYTLTLKNSFCSIPLSEGFSALGSGITNIGSAISNGAAEIWNGLTGKAELNIGQSLTSVTNATKEVVRELRANPTVITTTEKIILPISVTVSAVSAGAIMVTASVGSASFAFNLSQLLQELSFLRFYALAFVRLRRKKPWGKVSDKFSGKPLGGATVQIYESSFNKLKDAQITDAEGRFVATIAPGTYYLKIARRGFKPFETAPINITSPDQLLNLSINLEPDAEIHNAARIAAIKFWSSIKTFIDAINPYLLALGTLFGVTTVTVLPTAFNYAIIFIYLLLDAIKIYLAFHFIKPFGRVRNANDSPITLAIIRIYEEEKNVLLATKVTDESGRFSFLLSPGQYYLTCSKAGFAPFRSNTMTFQKAGLATLDIVLK